MMLDKEEAQRVVADWIEQFRQYAEVYWDLVPEIGPAEKGWYLAERIIEFDKYFQPLFRQMPNGSLVPSRHAWDELLRVYRWHSAFGGAVTVESFEEAWPLIVKDLLWIMHEKSTATWKEVLPRWGKL
jgi:hypothetical protein